MDKELKFESKTSPKETQKKDKKRKRSEAQIQQWESMRRRSTIIEHREINIDGVVCITFTEETQKALSCVVGEHVSAEVPWITIPKFQMMELLNKEKENSELYFIKDEIQNFQENDLLVGYNATSDKLNSFYVCITEIAKNDVLEMLEKMHEEEEWHVHNLLFRTAKDWCSLGSEKEVEECMAKNTRPLISLEIQTNLLNIRRPKLADNESTACVSFGPSRKRVSTIVRKRVHLALQACPQLKESVAQTNPPLPQNTWTQYEYSMDVQQQITDPDLSKQVNEFLKAKSPEMNDQVRCNAVFDLYKDEYQGLTLNKEEDIIPDSMDYKEFQFFVNVKHTKGKCISAATWHSMWSGLIACAYMDNIYTHDTNIIGDTDLILTEVHASKYVAIWSVQDSFSPKMILESPSEVSSLEFCPYNEKLLAAGCTNGQVLVWDVSSMLKNTKEEMNISVAQRGHHIRLHQLMGWMKPGKKYSYLIPTILSNIEISSISPVSCVRWLSPYRQICGTGNHIEVQENHQVSLQFISCHENGKLHIWDVSPYFKSCYEEDQQFSQDKKKLKGWKLFKELETGIKRKRRKCPPMKPIYEVAPEDSETGGYIPFSIIETESFPLRYVYAEETKLNGGMGELKQLRFKPVFQKPKFTPEYTLIFGSLEGNIIHAKWRNYEFPEEEPNVKSLECCFWGKAHDGPIIYLAVSPFNPGLILSVGGKVFAIWRDHMKYVPLLRRYCSTKVTGAAWSQFKPSIFYIGRADGNIEIWNLLHQSNKPISVQSISAQEITGIFPSRLAPFQNMIAFADRAGIFSVCVIPQIHITGNLKEEKKAVMKFFKREVERLETFNKCQEKWNASNEQILKTKADSEMTHPKKPLAGKASMIKSAQRQKHKDEKSLKKKTTVDLHGKNARIWTAEQETYMIDLMLEQRNLNEENLKKLYLPLMKFKEEEAIKKMRDTERKRKSENIFRITAEQEFPEVTKSNHKAATEDEKELPFTTESSAFYMEQYKMVQSASLQYIKDYKYKYTVNWSKMIEIAKERRRLINKMQQNRERKKLLTNDIEDWKC